MTDRRFVSKSLAGGSLVAVLVFLNTAVYGQSPRPRPRPAPAPARPSPAPARTGTLMAETDLACELTVDGQRRGVLETGAVISIDLSPGEHLARCSATADTEVAWRQTITVAVGSSKATLIELRALLDAKREAAERRAVELRRQAEEEAAAARALSEADERRRFEEAEARKTPQERANDVLRRAVEAMGGLDRIRKIQTISEQRVGEDGTTTMSLRLPGTVRFESTGAQRSVLVYNEATRSGIRSFEGPQGMVSNPWSPTPQEARQGFLPLLMADLIDVGLTYIGVSAGVVELERVMPGQFSSTVKYRFSANSGLLEEVGDFVRYSDYRDVQGVKVPFLITTTVPRVMPFNGVAMSDEARRTLERERLGPTVRSSRVTSLEFDIALPDSLFIVPAYTPTPSLFPRR